MSNARQRDVASKNVLRTYYGYYKPSSFKALRGPGHSRKCPGVFWFFLALKKNI